MGDITSIILQLALIQFKLLFSTYYFQIMNFLSDCDVYIKYLRDKLNSILVGNGFPMTWLSFLFQRLLIMTKLKKNQFLFIFNSGYNSWIEYTSDGKALAKNGDTQCKTGSEPVGMDYTDLEKNRWIMRKKISRRNPKRMSLRTMLEMSGAKEFPKARPKIW